MYTKLITNALILKTKIVLMHISVFYDGDTGGINPRMLSRCDLRSKHRWIQRMISRSEIEMQAQVKIHQRMLSQWMIEMQAQVESKDVLAMSNWDAEDDQLPVAPDSRWLHQFARQQVCSVTQHLEDEEGDDRERMQEEEADQRKRKSISIFNMNLWLHNLCWSLLLACLFCSTELCVPYVYWIYGG